MIDDDKKFLSSSRSKNSFLKQETKKVTIIPTPIDNNEGNNDGTRYISTTIGYEAILTSTSNIINTTAMINIYEYFRNEKIHIIKKNNKIKAMNSIVYKIILPFNEQRKIWLEF